VSKLHMCINASQGCQLSSIQRETHTIDPILTPHPRFHVHARPILCSKPHRLAAQLVKVTQGVICHLAAD